MAAIIKKPAPKPAPKPVLQAAPGTSSADAYARIAAANAAAALAAKDAADRESGKGIYQYVPPVNIASGGNAVATPSSVPAPPPAPNLPIFNPMTSSSTNFKVAPSDIIQFDDSSIEIALITDLLFEDIGATELANISRSDLIDGIDVVYAPIKNLPVIRREYDPRNIIGGYRSDYFSRFGIDLSFRDVVEPYFDNSGNLIIEIGIVEDNEDIQVQILTNGTIGLVENI